MNKTEALSWDIDMVTRNGERVARGIALLDKVKPEWWEILDGVNLNLWHNFHCVLGKVYGGYWTALYSLCPHSSYGADAAQWSIDHGFNAETLADKFEIEAAWLNAARTRKELAA